MMMETRAQKRRRLERLEEDLIQAATTGDINKTHELLKNSDLNVNNGEKEFQRTAFYLACKHGHLDVVKELLADKRVDINKVQSEGATPFNIACQQGHIEVVRLLLEKPEIDVNQANNESVAPFFFVCQDGDLELAKLLLQDPRVDINQGCNDGATALFMAAQKNYTELIEWIIASRDYVDIVATWQGMTAMDIALQEGYDDVTNLLRQLAINQSTTRMLLRRKLGLSAKTAANLFATALLFSDSHVRFKKFHNKNMIRFLNILKKLPFELQMIICNRYAELESDFINRALYSQSLKEAIQWFHENNIEKEKEKENESERKKKKSIQLMN